MAISEGEGELCPGERHGSWTFEFRGEWPPGCERSPICRALRYLAAFLHLVPSPPRSSTGREAASLAQGGQLSAFPARAGGLSSDRLMGPSCVPVGPPDLFSACEKPLRRPGRDAGLALPMAPVPSGHSWPGGERASRKYPADQRSSSTFWGCSGPGQLPPLPGHGQGWEGPLGPTSPGSPSFSAPQPQHPRLSSEGWG